MSARVRVRRASDGQLVAVKVGLDPANDIRLVHEAAMLAAARHPGVVGLVGLRSGADGLELITRWVGGRSLGDVQPLPSRDAAGVLGALAATVADLHRHGIVHGAIEPTHVILDRRGRPILCSFGRARLVTAANDPNAGCRPADDVAALGALLASVVGLPNDPELVPQRRFGRRLNNHLHRSLLTTADHAQADDPASRPSAASLADALAALAPDAALPASDDAAPSWRPMVAPSDELTADLERLRASAAIPKPRRSRWPFFTTALAFGCALVGTASLVDTTILRDSSPAEPSSATTATAAQATPVPDTRLVTTSTSSLPSPSSGATPIVHLGGRAFSIGQPGDRAVVGPWRCDGQDRALLLRPTSGEVFLFDEVPPPGADGATTSFGRYAGATDLAPIEPADDCPTPALVHADGRVMPIDLPGVAG